MLVSINNNIWNWTQNLCFTRACLWQFNFYCSCTYFWCYWM